MPPAVNLLGPVLLFTPKTDLLKNLELWYTETKNIPYPIKRLFGNMTRENLTAGLVVIGNEILSGRTQDTNTSWIAEWLTSHGIRLIEVRVVPDIESAIISAVNEMRGRVTYLLTTGGIGPTHDDITTESIAKAFGLSVEVNEEARKILISQYGGETGLTQSRLKMAMVPKGAELIENPVSGAPGFRVENVFVMAGVPRIMQAMMDDIARKIESGPPILSNTISCQGMSESLIAAELERVQEKYPDIEIGSYPHYRGGIMGLSLVLRSSDNDKVHTATQDIIDLIRRFGGEPRAMSIKSTGPAFKLS
jgi:molybdenum cofactor synthesis domain-containing protein